eukprot:7387787-Prymnesium_polylepis.1
MRTEFLISSDAVMATSRLTTAFDVRHERCNSVRIGRVLRCDLCTARASGLAGAQGYKCPSCFSALSSSDFPLDFRFGSENFTHRHAARHAVRT